MNSRVVTSLEEALEWLRNGPPPLTGKAWVPAMDPQPVSPTYPPQYSNSSHYRWEEQSGAHAMTFQRPAQELLVKTADQFAAAFGVACLREFGPRIPGLTLDRINAV